MVSALDSRASGPGSSPGRETMCCILGQDTLLSQRLSPSRCINGCGELYDWRNPVMD